MACTLAYQSAAEKAIEKVGPPSQAGVSVIEFDDTVEDVDFSNFTISSVAAHAFVAQSDRILERFLPVGGFSQEQVNQIIQDIHEELPRELNALITNGKSKEKFDTLFRWLQLPAEGRTARAALRRHADYVSWVFNEAPVFQCEAYALADVCIEAECSRLTYGDLRAEDKQGRIPPDPFAEGDANGGRHPLLETVMGYITNPKFREAIVIQGSAGCGKSTFTLRLADHLREAGLRPIRIRLRDVVLGKEFYSQLGEALSYQDELYLSRHERFVASENPLSGGAVFQEEIRYGPRPINLCPYILILDGWDEISVAVSEGFRQRVKELLLRIRSELFRSDRPIVRVILTGRPSDAIDDCSEFFQNETPVLTVRTLHPAQLPAYAEKLREAIARKRLFFEGMSVWTFPDDPTLKPVFDRYLEEFNAGHDNHRVARRKRGTRETGVAAVLGYPLLLHVTFRLLAEPNVDRQDLIENPAALLRQLTDYATFVADQPSDRERGAKIQARMSGSNLRVLLRRTAAIMSILGQESVSKSELEKRLKTSDIVGHVKDVAKDNIISALLVSFYFRGGNTALGCEFTHKAFREYLFAEEIVETLKSFARTVPGDLPERPSSLYWKDFDDADPRRKVSIELATILGPQWLSPEVVRYLGSLFEWEVRRTYAQNRDHVWEGQTAPIADEEWQRLLTLLADLWDWWADGVHLRPQPWDNEYTGQIEWSKSLADRLVPMCRPITAGNVPEPIRTATIDAHFGDALFRICSWLYWNLALHPGSAQERRRRFQGLNGQRLAFRPTGPNPDYFSMLCYRISAAGWRPEGVFPIRVFGRGTDFSDTTITNVRFDYADLEGSSFENATINNCIGHYSNLKACDFTASFIDRSSLMFACLESARFAGAVISDCRFSGAALRGAGIAEAIMEGGALFLDSPGREDRGLVESGIAYYGDVEGGGFVPVPPCEFTDSIGIEPLERALLENQRRSQLYVTRNEQSHSGSEEPKD